MTIQYSDDWMLSDDDQLLLTAMRADNRRIAAIPADQRGSLRADRQADPLGILPDGTLVRARPDRV
jgi:hypothetical protein